MQQNQQPKKQGLYDPNFEHDACGIGFIASLKGKANRLILEQGIEMLCRLEHRGAQAGDSSTGDGAGIMTTIPHLFFKKVCSSMQIKTPGSYGVGMIFLPPNQDVREQCEKFVQQMIEEEGQDFLGWRTVTIDDSSIGKKAKASQPWIRQIFIGRARNMTSNEFERKLFVIRKRIEKKLSHINGFYVASLSSRTIVYKGMLTPTQLEQFYLDLQDEDFKSSFILVHSRYSTNTFPSWERAHPNRLLAHNGEINTLKGNINWMNAREKVMRSSFFGGKIDELVPIIKFQKG